MKLKAQSFDGLSHRFEVTGYRIMKLGIFLPARLVADQQGKADISFGFARSHRRKTKKRDKKKQVE